MSRDLFEVNSGIKLSLRACRPYSAQTGRHRVEDPRPTATGRRSKRSKEEAVPIKRLTDGWGTQVWLRSSILDSHGVVIIMQFV